MTTGNREQFGRIPYAFVESGALAGLTGAEVKVWVVIAAHADQHWTACPSVDRIASRAGLDKRTVQKVLARLVKRNCLIVTQGGGRSRTNLYRMVVNGVQPGEKGCPPGHCFEGEKGGRRGQKRWPAMPERVASHATNGGPQATRKDKNKEQQTPAEETADDVPQGSGQQQEHSLDVMRQMLMRIGVDRKAAATLAETPGLSPNVIAVMVGEASDKVTNLPGWLRYRIENGDMGSKRLTPELLCRAAKRGCVHRVGSLILDKPGLAFKHNEQGFYVLKNSERIGKVAAHELANVEVE